MTNKNSQRKSSFSELAREYFPNVEVRSAVQQLHRWINKCKELKEKLIEAGLIPRQRLLTPRQYDLIIEFLGEPGE